MTAPSIDRPGLLADDALAESLPALLALATALTGDAEAGAGLVAASLTRRPALVRHATTAELPEVRLRGLVVQQYLAKRDRRPTADALASMPRRQRAAVVLRDGLLLTSSEIAAVMDRPAAQVAADLEASPDQTGTVTALMAAAPDPQSVADRLEPARRAHRNRRLRLALLGLVAAVVAAGLVAIPTVILPALPVPARAAGEWRYSYQVRPDDGWAVVQRVVSAQSETTQVKPPVPANDPYTCWVQVYVPGAFSTDGLSSTGSVHGRPALTGTTVDGNGFLAWEYGNNAWAQTSCSTLKPESDVLRRLAAMVEFGSHDVALPFSLSALPKGFQISGLVILPASSYTEVNLSPTDEGAPLRLVVSGPLNRFATLGAAETIGGRTWHYLDGSEPRICTTDAAGRTLCVSGESTQFDNANPGLYTPDAGPTLRSVAALLTPADLGDPAHWPSASQLPH